MPVIVTIRVSSPEAELLAGYDSVKVYRSNFEDGIFLEVSGLATRPSLTVTQIYYNFTDTTGTSSSWYKTSFYGSVTLLESSLSASSRGIEIEQEHSLTTYPAEISLTSSDEYHINKIRYYIGDQKQVIREYVSPECTSGYQNVSQDGYTYELENKGWPLRVVKDSTEYTSTSDVYVTDYKYLTFSTSSISTVSGVLDLWSETFRHSDREILKTYNMASAPAFVSTSSVTTEMLRLDAAITIIRMEIADLMGRNSGSFELTGEIKYNPEPLLRQKMALLAELKSKLDDLAGEVYATNITGVRID